MPQRKISEMFAASQASSPRRSQPDLPSNNKKPGRHGNHVNASSQDADDTLSSAKRCPTRKQSQGSGQATAKSPQNTQNTPSAASFLSIPSTPLSEPASSQSRSQKIAGRAEDKVPETPQRRAASGGPSQRTPNKPIATKPGTSPYTPIELSSGDESSECVIQSVQPAPNKKRKRKTASTPKVTPTKRAKAKETTTETPRRDSVKQETTSRKKPVASKPTTPKTAGKKPAPQEPVAQKSRATSSTSSITGANLSNGSSGFTVSNTASPAPQSALPAIKKKYLKGIKYQLASSTPAASKEPDSDHIIEKAQATPKRRRQSPAKKPPCKKIRLGDSNAPVPVVDSKPAEADSDCEFVKVIRTPKKQASVASPIIHIESDTDSEYSEEENNTVKKALANQNKTAPVKSNSAKPNPAKPDTIKPNPVKPDPAKPDYTKTPSRDSTSDTPLINPAPGLLPPCLVASAGNAEGGNTGATVAPTA
ncbi:hypothetical protein G7Z17_g3731 [Cylindrodendrum hubeiense]|uniref:Uncharacterized protein n=1 Tax=Cylindrodendrum hubeiense TaxID=595255 RepID=A0A9P5LJN7_9HYPO|nr:hypothetical protein G7Z17_g3731 [Cylindrodendrum hubeiense]